MINLPILPILICLPLIGLLFILMSSENDENSIQSKKSAIWTSLSNFLLSLYLPLNFNKDIPHFQFVNSFNWFNSDNLKFILGVDGISMPFIVLSTFLILLCVIYIYPQKKKNMRMYLASFILLESFLVGTFSAIDLFSFYIFFESILIPMYLIIGFWGGDRRVYSAYKFFLYTLLGSVLMLIAIIFLYQEFGTTSIARLLDYTLPFYLQVWLWLAFFASFAVKIPMWPFHTWLPDAHVEAPTAGSVLLAAILLKMAGYGFIRFSIGLFPLASDYFTPFIFSLSLIAIIYTSLVALMQEDMKKLIAYSSVAHMGYVTLGIFTLTQQGVQGSLYQMISHGMVSAALFISVGVIYERMHTRLIKSYGGIVTIMPRFAVLLMIFALASLGLPGTTGFIGEFLILIAAFEKNTIVAFIASLGVILGAAYMLWLYRRVVFGKIRNEELKQMKDLNKSEILILVLLALPILYFGFYPDPILKTVNISVENLINNYDLILNNEIVRK